jgi:glycosyltransferase involved in cell wall biosynthesis
LKGEQLAMKRRLLDSAVGQMFWGSSAAQKILSPIYKYQAYYKTKERLDKELIKDLGKYNIQQPVGRCLVSYVTGFVKYLCQNPEVGIRGWDPATLPSKMEELSQGFSRHTMSWESVEMIRQFIERGFIVDCISSRDAHMVTNVSDYDVIVDEWTSLPQWTVTKSTTKKLYYATGCHWIYHNQADLLRHEWLFARRGIAIPPSRQLPPTLNPSAADLISFFGNSKVKATYGSYSSKMRNLSISATHVPTEYSSKKWEIARNHFLWFGGGGWVYKGLDLVVEAFLKEPKLQLSICGGALDASDTYFWKIYGDDIKKSGNITYHGHLDPTGKEFQHLVNSVSAVVYPSSAEGCAGAVVQCLQHGLIPLVSEITGLNIHNTWQPLFGTTDSEFIDNIRQRCNEIAQMPECELESLRHMFWDFAHKNHSRTAYSHSLSIVLDELLV